MFIVPWNKKKQLAASENHGETDGTAEGMYTVCWRRFREWLFKIMECEH